jgi:membrane protease YdiL (CAAX protease family)
MPLINAAVAALLNLLLLAGVPFLFYFIWHRTRHKRSLREIAQRAGLQWGERRYLGYSLSFALVAVAALLFWRPALEPFVRVGSPQRAFAGLGFGVSAVVLALLYGVVKTGLTEEVLFRGLIAGSLARRLPAWGANLVQALIFLLPHLLAVRLMPELRGMLVLIFAGAIFLGWVRLKSGSMLGPWLIHASLNTAMCLSVAVRTAA